MPNTATRPDGESIEHKFYRLRDEWHGETAHLSNPTVIFMHHAHMKIIGMGREALPFILREVERESGHWFVALESIVEPAESMGATYEEIRRSWREWGKQQGLI